MKKLRCENQHSLNVARSVGKMSQVQFSNEEYDMNTFFYKVEVGTKLYYLTMELLQNSDE